MRRGAKPGKAKVKARLPVARKAAKKEASGRRELEKRLAEALQREAEALRQLQTSHCERAETLDQQTATSEILRVISSSPTDSQPVFDAIVGSATHLCNGLNAAAFLYGGELLHNVALSDASPEAREEIARHFPQRPNPEFAVGRVVLTGAIVHSADVRNDPSLGEGARRTLQFRGIRALI